MMLKCVGSVEPPEIPLTTLSLVNLDIGVQGCQAPQALDNQRGRVIQDVFGRHDQVCWGFTLLFRLALTVRARVCVCVCECVS